MKNEADQRIQNAHGSSCLEFESSIPTKFMVGTDRGNYFLHNIKYGQKKLERCFFLYRTRANNGRGFYSKIIILAMG